MACEKWVLHTKTQFIIIIIFIQIEHETVGGPYH